MFPLTHHGLWEPQGMPQAITASQQHLLPKEHLLHPHRCHAAVFPHDCTFCPWWKAAQPLQPCSWFWQLPHHRCGGSAVQSPPLLCLFPARSDPPHHITWQRMCLALPTSHAGSHSSYLLRIRVKALHLGSLFLLRHPHSPTHSPLLSITHMGTLRHYFQETGM